ncbi:MAG TPA: DUF962 domain-containing protein [Terriglobales bacterium]|jgi:uncharacterized membrane protein YGL010W|nr:DUF962 domain-containing protein [Terriglobales bacterium]
MKLLSLYDDQHTHPVNRALHLVAIPLGFSSVVVVWWHPILGLLLIPAALGLATLGHVIEGNQPAFTKNPAAILIAPVWLWKFVASKMHKSETVSSAK